MKTKPLNMPARSELEGLIPPPPPPPRDFRRGPKGSTLVGVIAALVFIGIVVAAMLKNTGSQTAVSRGYGADLVMNSTVSSGIVATESYMQSTNAAFKEKALLAIQNIIDFNTPGKTQIPANEHPYVFGTATDGRRELATGTGQFFSSRLMSFDEASMHATFEFESGKNRKGKVLKKAQAFYLVDGLEITGGAPFPGTSTLFLGGEMIGGQADLTINGYATFMKSIQTNPTGSIVFNPISSTNNSGNVFFNDNVFSSGGATMTFNVPTFFNAATQLSGSPVFNEDVGFNKNAALNSDNGILTVNKKVWVNDGFLTLNLGDPACVSDAPPSYCYYSRTMSIKGNGSSELFYNTGVTVPTTSNITTTTQAYDKVNVLRALGMVNEATVTQNAPTNASAAAKARLNAEPTLSPSNLTQNGSKEFLKLSTLTERNPVYGGLEVSLGEVEEWYNTYSKTNPENQKYYNEGHLLVELDIPVTFTGTSGTFNNKIAFVVGEESSINGKYFNSGANASTLIYVDKKGRLANFGCEENFRGLIYVPDDHVGNTTSKDNTFQWGENSTISGALLLKGENTKISWNINAAGTVTLNRDDDILKAFAGWVTGNDGGADKTVTITGDHIILKPLGYYYNLK